LRTVVLDANVVFKWFTRQPEPGHDAAQALRDELERGDLDLVVPHLLALELLNVVARKWRWPADDVAELAEALDLLPWRVVDPSVRAIAAWVARGLTPFDATYVALAEALGCVVVSDDTALRRAAGALAEPLSG
jgi:predicted nucleic acid-binding protein